MQYFLSQLGFQKIIANGISDLKSRRLSFLQEISQARSTASCHQTPMSLLHEEFGYNFFSKVTRYTEDFSLCVLSIFEDVLGNETAKIFAAAMS